MAIEEEPEPGIPEWVVTFGDMMSLLLTFFIMLVSMSEIKEEEKYQAMLESMRRQFGHEMSVAALVPGDKTPRNSNMRTMNSMGRAKRLDVMRGGNPVKAPVGEHNRVHTVRPGNTATSGGVIFFEEDSAELSLEGREKLIEIADQIAGKPQKIEIRGHTSRKSQREGRHWELSFARCQVVLGALLESGIDPDRIRLGAAGASEPIDEGIDPKHRMRNARVEVLMWDEAVGGG